jgi:hypothetical protein
MKNDSNPLQTHLWADGDTPHQILQDGRTIAHQRCIRCGRDFGFELDGSGWHAIHVSVFRVEFLPQAVSSRWLTEECPREPLPSDDVDRATLQVKERTTNSAMRKST